MSPTFLLRQSNLSFRSILFFSFSCPIFVDQCSKLRLAKNTDNGLAKKSPPNGRGFILFRVIDNLGLTKNVNLDLAGIGKLGFDLLGDVSG